MNNNKQIMKKILIATLLIGVMSGCTKNSKTEKADVGYNGLPFNVVQFNHEGHKYLYYGNGGLIHSESCKCKEGNNEQR